MPGKIVKRIQFRTDYRDYGTVFYMLATRGERGPNQLRAGLDVRFRRGSNCKPSFKVLVNMRRNLTRYLRDASLPTSIVRKVQRKRRAIEAHPV